MPAAKTRYHYRIVVLEEVASFKYNHTINYLTTEWYNPWLAQRHRDMNCIK